ncbi:N-acetyltransferase [Nitrospirillum sp. BR 11163]|uniref:GNAT family N-acetyltransferase n=1 Tax=Nitrospirillum sp. BR 11163 TaxID=3104323 RepID=UPI002AFF62E7|nr:N-acetyltransferase [Nitrospirillum sp. BR 11163]MEA1672568.1 N-acetyltransferase [Nitrospirillum sp. BR 11163]
MLILRPETATDAPAIRALTDAAFKDAPHSGGTEAAIVDALRNAGALTVSLVAVQEGVIVGHVAFSPVTIDGRSGGWFGLGPVSVESIRQRRGIGGALIREGLRRLVAMGAEGCVVLGEPAYYSRFGFVADSRLRYPGVPPEYFQRLAFTGTGPAGTDPEGEVAYHPGFGAGA